jgi:hypothetical protein
MIRLALLPAALLLAATTPYAVSVPGTVVGAVVAMQVQSGPVPVCMVNGAIALNGASFVNLGPTPSLYRRDSSGADIAISFPRVAHGTITTNGKTKIAAFDYLSVGTAALFFTSGTGGYITFIGGGNTIQNNNIAPVFSSYVESWNQNVQQLTVKFNLNFGPCIVPVSAIYQY